MVALRLITLHPCLSRSVLKHATGEGAGAAAAVGVEDEEGPGEVYCSGARIYIRSIPGKRKDNPQIFTMFFVRDGGRSSLKPSETHACKITYTDIFCTRSADHSPSACLPSRPGGFKLSFPLFFVRCTLVCFYACGKHSNEAVRPAPCWTARMAIHCGKALERAPP